MLTVFMLERVRTVTICVRGSLTGENRNNVCERLSDSLYLTECAFVHQLERKVFMR